MQHKLSTYGVITQHISEIQPLLIFTPQDMIDIFKNLGANSVLNLEGRPTRPLGVLMTSKVKYCLFIVNLMFYRSIE